MKRQAVDFSLNLAGARSIQIDEVRNYVRQRTIVMADSVLKSSDENFTVVDVNKLPEIFRDSFLCSFNPVFISVKAEYGKWIEAADVRLCELPPIFFLIFSLISLTFFRRKAI